MALFCSLSHNGNAIIHLIKNIPSYLSIKTFDGNIFTLNFTFIWQFIISKQKKTTYLADYLRGGWGFRGKIMMYRSNLMYLSYLANYFLIIGKMAWPQKNPIGCLCYLPIIWTINSSNWTVNTQNMWISNMYHALMYILITNWNMQSICNMVQW